MPLNESNVLVRLRLLGASRFAAEARGASAGLGTMSKASMGAATRLRGVGAAMGTAGSAIAGGARLLRRAAFPLAAIGGLAVKSAADFQTAMELIHTQAGASQKEVEQLRGRVLALAKVSPQGPTQLANALYRLEGAGIRGKNAMKALTAASQLAAVGNADVESTAKTLSQTWFSGIKGAGNFQHVVAELNATVGAGDLRLNQLVDALGVGILPVAKNAGLTLRDITGVMSVFGDETNNVSGWTAQLATALHYLYAPTAKAKKAMAGINLSASQLGQDFRKRNGLLTAMRDLRSHLDKLPGGFRGLKASQTLAEILPGGRGRVLNVLLGQLDRYQGKLRQVGATTGKWGDSLAKTQETATYRIKTAWSSIQVAGVQLGSVLLPAVVPAITAVATAIGSVTTAGINLGKGRGGKAIKDFFGGLAGHTPKGPRPTRLPGRAMEPQGPARQLNASAAAGTSLRSKLSPVIGWIKRQLPVVGHAFMSAGRQLLQAFKPAMPFITNVLLPLLKGIAAGVIITVVGAFKILIPIIRIVAGAFGFIGRILKPFKGIITGIGVVIGVLLSGEILGLLGAIPKIGGVFRLVAVPIRIVGAVFRWLFGVVARVVSIWLRAHLAVLRFVGTFVSAPGRLVRAALNIVGGVIHVIETLPGKMVGIAGRVISKLVGGLGGGVGRVIGRLGSIFGRIGSAIVHAIVSAIKSAPGAIASAISSIIPGPVKGAVNKVLGFGKGLIGGATGMTVARGGWAVVGERGPELAHFPTGSAVYDAGQTRRARSGHMAGAAPIVLTANLHLSGKQIHSEVFRIDRAQREAM